MTNYDNKAYEKVEKYIRTKSGCVRGRLCFSIYGDPYYCFLRIPYAEPPVGELRFRAPIPADPWSHLLDGTVNANKPLHYNFTKMKTEGSEDCLYLNIYVKQFDTESPLPVMVYLFGGGFEKGDPTSERHGPDYFMSKHVVLITIGYRVGPFGFLSFTDPSLNCPGNAGLKDQLLALLWVKENVCRFNGDPENITLFGCSAGAVSAHYLSMSYHAEGLFHKLILQSGVAFCEWALCTLPCLPHRLAQSLGYCGPDSPTCIFKFLQHADGETMARANLLKPEEKLRGHFLTFGPVVEPPWSPLSIIPHVPEVLCPKAWGNNLPMLIGGTSFEGLTMMNRIKAQQPEFLKNAKENQTFLLPWPIQKKFPLKRQETLAKILYKLYFIIDDIEDVIAFCNFISHKIFWHPIHRTLLTRQWYARQPTYVYRFDFDSPFYNLYRIRHCGGEVRGASHCDDLAYLFHSSDSFKLEDDTSEYATIQRMVDIWTSFAKNSNPNCRSVPKCEWTPLEEDNDEPIKCLNISDELKVIELPELRTLKIWNGLYKECLNYDEDD